MILPWRKRQGGTFPCPVLAPADPPAYVRIILAGFRLQSPAWVQGYRRAQNSKSQRDTSLWFTSFTSHIEHSVNLYFFRSAEEVKGRDSAGAGHTYWGSPAPSSLLCRAPGGKSWGKEVCTWGFSNQKPVQTSFLFLPPQPPIPNPQAQLQAHRPHKADFLTCLTPVAPSPQNGRPQRLKHN